MGSIKLPHASGNSMSIAAPATNPASDLELKLPATIGTASQVLKNSSTPGTLEFASVGTWHNETAAWTDLTSGSEVILTGWPSDTEEISIHFSAISVAEANRRLEFVLGTGASTFQTSGYKIVNPRRWTNNTAVSNWTSEITFHGPGGVANNIDGCINLRKQNNSNRWEVFGYEHDDQTLSYIEEIFGYGDAGGATMSHIKFYVQSSGTFDGSGKFRVVWRTRS